MFDAIGSALPHIQSGALRALGVTSAARLRVLPDIPPIGDAVPGYAVSGWLGIGVPKGTPAETVERVVGGPIDPQPYLAYLREKLAAAS